MDFQALRLKLRNVHVQLNQGLMDRHTASLTTPTHLRNSAQFSLLQSIYQLYSICFPALKNYLKSNLDFLPGITKPEETSTLQRLSHQISHHTLIIGESQAILLPLRGHECGNVQDRMEALSFWIDHYDLLLMSLIKKPYLSEEAISLMAYLENRLEDFSFDIPGFKKLKLIFSKLNRLLFELGFIISTSKAHTMSLTTDPIINRTSGNPSKPTPLSPESFSPENLTGKFKNSCKNQINQTHNEIESQTSHLDGSFTGISRESESASESTLIRTNVDSGELHVKLVNTLCELPPLRSGLIKIDVFIAYIDLFIQLLETEAHESYFNRAVFYHWHYFDLVASQYFFGKENEPLFLNGIRLGLIEFHDITWSASVIRSIPIRHMRWSTETNSTRSLDQVHQYLVMTMQNR